MMTGCCGTYAKRRLEGPSTASNGVRERRIDNVRSDSRRNVAFVGAPREVGLVSAVKHRKVYALQISIKGWISGVRCKRAEYDFVWHKSEHEGPTGSPRVRRRTI